MQRGDPAVRVSDHEDNRDIKGSVIGVEFWGRVLPCAGRAQCLGPDVFDGFPVNPLPGTGICGLNLCNHCVERFEFLLRYAFMRDALNSGGRVDHAEHGARGRVAFSEHLDQPLHERSSKLLLTGTFAFHPDQTPHRLACKGKGSMKIATFNINGIKARLPALLDWLKEAEPDVVLLQEIKSLDENFPREPIEDLGFQVETHGQKSFNGVAILSKRPLEDITRGLPGDESDEQARWIEATVTGDAGTVRVCCLYLPNGNPAPGPKFDYKLAWMTRLESRARALMALEEPVVLAGDYNVIPQSEDVHRPDDWRDDALFRPESRDAFQRIINLGFTEAFRSLDPAPLNYTFWDYQSGAWNKNDGIRIDHLLLTPEAADHLVECKIDRDVRGREKPSDHVPVWVDLAI